MITLNNRTKINKHKMRVGRGIGSGKGKTGFTIGGVSPVGHINDWIFSRFIIAIFVLEIGLKPLLGSLLYNGICPPSKALIATPDLDF